MKTVIKSHNSLVFQLCKLINTIQYFLHCLILVICPLPLFLLKRSSCFDVPGAYNLNLQIHDQVY